MIMRRASTLLVLFVAACASSGAKSGHQEPEMRLVQLSSVADAARNMTGGLSVQFSLTINNTTGMPLQLKRIELSSVTEGAYSLSPLSRSYDETIVAGISKDYELWGTAIASSTISGVNGPVTIRAVAQFESSLGRFQSVIVQQVRGPNSF